MSSARLAVPSALFAALAWGCAGDAPPAVEPPAHRLLVVGWDGAGFELLDRLLDEGRLPALAALLERGQSATLDSTIVPISSAAWTSGTTGKGPGETGVYGFFEAPHGSYDVELVSARSNRAAPIWRILSARGIGVAVVGVPLTYPPEPVLGTMVAGMLSPFEGEYAWPNGLADRLRERGFEPDLGIWRDQKELSWERVEEQLAIKSAFVDETLARDDWSFAMVVFKSLDVLSHRLYDGRDDTAVAQLLEKLDGILGRMVAAAGPETNVLLVSDHGFATYRFGFNVQRWLADEGFSASSEDGPAAGPAASGPMAERGASDHRRRLASLDLAKSRAFADISEGNFGGIRLNMVGREPRGLVREDQRDALLSEIETRLRAMPGREPSTSLVLETWRTDELYPGPHRGALPDLVFRVQPDVQVIEAERQPAIVTFPRSMPDHARAGILVAAGPSIASAGERGHADIVDLTPTFLTLLDQPVHDEMTGRVLTELFRKAPAVRSIPEADAPGLAAPSAGAGYDDEALDEIRERMRALGYVE